MSELHLIISVGISESLHVFEESRLYVSFEILLHLKCLFVLLRFL